MKQIDILDELKKILTDFIGTVNGTKAIFLATLDGHVLLERNIEEYPIEQMTPMSGSVLGISDTLSSQLLNQKLQDNIIIMDKNILGLFKVLDKDDSLFIGVLCDRMVNLGKMITFGRLTTKEINTILVKHNF